MTRESGSSIAVGFALVAALASLPAPAAAASAWCSESGDSCVSTFVRDGIRYVRSAYAERYVTRDTICVVGPRREECRGGRLRRSPRGVWHVTKRWRASYSFQGAGVYRVYAGTPSPHSRAEPHASFRVAASSARAARAVHVRVGMVGIGSSRAVVRPDRISLGSTGYISDIRWSGWGGKVAIGRGTGHATSSSVDPEDREGPAKIRLRKRLDCGGRLFYTVVSYRALGFGSKESLGCTGGLHP